MADLRVIIFDCDGTLVDSGDVICRAMDRAFERHGLTPPSHQATRSIIGLDLYEALRTAAPDLSANKLHPVGESFKAAFLEMRAAGRDFAPLYPHCRETIENLRSTDAILSIATGKPRHGLDHFLEQHIFADTFFATQTADDAPGKPHPGMIDNILRATGADGAQAIMIGDTSFDMEMAHNAGCRAIGVDWGYHEAAALYAAGASAVAEDFRALLVLIEEAFAA